jgi:hypothetical protein
MPHLLGRLAQRAFTSAKRTTSNFFGNQTKRLLNASNAAKPAGNNTLIIGALAVTGVSIFFSNRLRCKAESSCVFRIGFLNDYLFSTSGCRSLLLFQSTEGIVE